jgi:integrative and conjugative element protein (TIGR02256 family)
MSAVVFTPGAARKLAELAVMAGDGLETGGILLGYDHGLAGPIVVRHCGGPGPAAIRRRAYFRRDTEHAAAVAAEAAAADGSAWIGEWHTHGVEMPEPSSRDLRTYRKLLDDPELVFARFLAVIVIADRELGWRTPLLSAWSFTGSVLRELELRIASSAERTATKETTE